MTNQLTVLLVGLTVEGLGGWGFRRLGVGGARRRQGAGGARRRLGVGRAQEGGAQEGGAHKELYLRTGLGALVGLIKGIDWVKLLSLAGHCGSHCIWWGS